MKKAFVYLVFITFMQIMPSYASATCSVDCHKMPGGLWVSYEAFEPADVICDQAVQHHYPYYHYGCLTNRIDTVSKTRECYGCWKKPKESGAFGNDSTIEELR